MPASCLDETKTIAPPLAAPAATQACWAGAGLVAMVSLVFYWLHWDRFLAPSSAGVFPYTAQLILEGKVPYRDFFIVIPPLHPLKIAAPIEIFGQKLMVARIEARRVPGSAARTRRRSPKLTHLRSNRMTRPASALWSASRRHVRCYYPLRRRVAGSLFVRIAGSILASAAART